MMGVFGESDSDDDGGDYGDSAGNATSRQSADKSKNSTGGHMRAGQRVNPYLGAVEDSSGEDVAEQQDDGQDDFYVGSDDDDEDFSGQMRGLGHRGGGSRGGKAAGYDVPFSGAAAALSAVPGSASPTYSTVLEASSMLRS